MEKASNTSNAPVYQPLGSNTPSEGSQDIKPVKQQGQPEKTGFFKKLWNRLMKKTDKEKAIAEVTSHTLQETATHQTASSPAKHTYKTLSHTAQAAQAEQASTSRPPLTKPERAAKQRELENTRLMNEEAARLRAPRSTPPPAPAPLSREEVLAKLIEKEAADKLKAPTAPPTPFIGRTPRSSPRSREAVQARLLAEEPSRLNPVAEEASPPLPPRPKGTKQPTKPPPLASTERTSPPAEELSPLGKDIIRERKEELDMRDVRAREAWNNQRRVNQDLMNQEASKLKEPTPPIPPASPSRRPPPPSQPPRGKGGA